MPCSVKRTSQAVLQRTGGKRGVGPLAFFCMVHGVRAVIHAADGMANLQVFCSEKSGNGCPVSVCLGSGISQEKLPLYLGFFEFVHNVRKRG
jgi:hypothetical protein